MADKPPDLLEQILTAVQAKAPVIRGSRFGRLVVEWQDGRLVWSTVEAKEKHT